MFFIVLSASSKIRNPRSLNAIAQNNLVIAVVIRNLRKILNLVNSFCLTCWSVFEILGPFADYTVQGGFIILSRKGQNRVFRGVNPLPKLSTGTGAAVSAPKI